MLDKTPANKTVYIVDGARSPFFKFNGEPGFFSASDLAVKMGQSFLARQPFSAAAFDELIVGCAGPSEDEANIARLIALRLGCRQDMPAWTVQRNCASGLQAIDCARQNILSGRSNLVLAGGCEAMSRAPFLFNKGMVKWLAQLNKAKNTTKKLKTLLRFRPHFMVPIIGLLRGLNDSSINLNMGQTAEELAFCFDISRMQMDDYASQSHLKAKEAQSLGLFEEIMPIYAKDGTVYEEDDGIRNDSTVEKLSKLKAAFDKYGNITAGNSSQITDGAALTILASEKAVEEYGLTVESKIVDIDWAALDPRIMGLGPIHAMTPILKRQSLTIDDIDHFEINEAFAAQVIACIKAWDDETYCQKFLGLENKIGPIEMKKLNPHGGAIALGHPVGASGARIVLHLSKMMQRYNHRYAMGSLCIGGGQGGAILLEKV